ncbi:MAG: WXG100 family type VII secretion target [Lachnospiraceae bacterium]|nr:WXG100 family type VII secretion target [Lachnospiraceae bacterium]MCR5407268.1 WXG100 family type VII secretion target [Lachnospiraceae bacterium]
MADMTNVDAAKLRQSASRIGNLAGELSGNVNKINETLNNLSKSWVSEAATRFMQNWRTDEEALKEMVDQYREVADLMNELAADFNASENEVDGMVGKLKI